MDEKDLEKVTGGRNLDSFIPPIPPAEPQHREPFDPDWHKFETVQWVCQKCGNIVWEGQRISQPSSYLYCNRCGNRVIDS